jgi:hypothetical protein
MGEAKGSETRPLRTGSLKIKQTRERGSDTVSALQPGLKRRLPVSYFLLKYRLYLFLSQYMDWEGSRGVLKRRWICSSIRA